LFDSSAYSRDWMQSADMLTAPGQGDVDRITSELCG
jgi:hypothetical protein